MKPAASDADVSGTGGYALLTDGTTIEIRSAQPGDLDAVRQMHAAMSPDNTYMRFFNLSPHAAEEEAKRVCRPAGSDHAALLAWLGDELIGVASYEPTGKDGIAEIAFAVADHMHGRGVATLLLEYLVSLARAQKMHAFTAETLAANTAMLKVFADAGLSVQRKVADGTIELTFPLPNGDGYRSLDAYLTAVALRESHADVESLRSMLHPGSVAVVGASRKKGTVGRAILHNIISGGFEGHVFAVNPHARHIEGVTCVPSVSDLPEPVDLAVIAVPATAVSDVAEECGRRGVKGVVVITSGLDTDQGAALLNACRRFGMRLIGPNCFGVAVPGIGLDATFAARHPKPGKAGLVMQSGGLGFALVDHLSRLGVGVSSFASVGNKYDISSNDMLMWWEQDGLTRLAILYIESFGNPRKFARTARRVGQQMPVLTVPAGRSAAGQSAAASHTAAVATPLVSREALFEQAGIIVTPTFGELLDAVALFATQPVPTGSCVSIVSNVGGAGVLAADVCVESGLVVHTPSQETQRRLREIVPAGGAVTGPVDTTATVTQADFRRCLELVAADDGVDAVLALVLPTAATGDLVEAICDTSLDLTLAAVVLDQAEGVTLLGQTSKESSAKASGGTGLVPAYAYPESAARALAYAAKYGAWRARPQGNVPEFSDLCPDEAHALASAFLEGLPDGGWLPPDKVAGLLGCYGVPLVRTRRAVGEDAAVAAAAEIGGPVVLKADVPGLVHKTDAGAVQLDVRTPEDVQESYRTFTSRFGKRLSGVLVQPMISNGTEVIIGVVQEPVFGPLVVFGLGGVATEVLGDHVARLTPLSDTDADELIHTIHAAPLLLGHRGSPAADITALRETLLRVSRLADDLPEIAELDLNPVIARPDGIFAVDARIRLAPVEPRDPFLRRLR
ncbi:MAG: GNAT family N-acetyltransferase [Micromonosporaceae bacterium]